jgi:ribosomal-protein-alanine N-acetyltransferase
MAGENDRRPRIDIRPLALRDIEAVLAIEAASFSSPWSLRTFYHILALENDFRAFIAVGSGAPLEDVILGYGAFFDLGEECHLISLAVHPDHRRRGVGGKLLAHMTVLAWSGGAVRITLEVRLSNKAAAAFYEAHGFSPVAIRDRYYEDDGESALVMWKHHPERH